MPRKRPCSTTPGTSFTCPSRIRSLRDAAVEDVMALVGHVRLVADGSPLGVGQQAEQTEREQGRAEPRRSPDADKDVFRVLQQVEAAFSRPRGLCRQAPSWWRVCPAFVRIVPSGLSVQFPVRAKGTGSSVGASRDQPGLGSRPLPARRRNRPATIGCPGVPPRLGRASEAGPRWPDQVFGLPGPYRLSPDTKPRGAGTRAVRRRRANRARR
jgi:hypothetical protein